MKTNPKASDPAWLRRRWNLLAEFAHRWEEYEGSEDFDFCTTSCDGSQCEGRTYKRPPCKSELWPRCPLRDLESSRWQDARREYGAAQVSPISEWPDGFVAWAQDALTAMRVEDERAKARAMDEARDKRGSGPSTSRHLPPMSQNHKLPRTSRGPKK